MNKSIIVRRLFCFISTLWCDLLSLSWSRFGGVGGVSDVRFCAIDMDRPSALSVLNCEIRRIDGDDGKWAFKSICDFIESFFSYPYMISYFVICNVRAPT